jgi:hypothetical protein
MRLKDQKGAFVVEFALILPIFLLLIFGIMDFGWYFFVQHTLQFATREGTRLALVGRQLDDPGHPGQLLSREASIVKTIRENAALAVNNPNEVHIYIFPVSSDSGYQDPTNYENLPRDVGGAGDYMRVKTSYTFRFMTPLIGAFFPQWKIDVQAQATYKNERFDTGG